VDDTHAGQLAADVARKIEKELQYPGQIKVVVIRETRAMESPARNPGERPLRRRHLRLAGPPRGARPRARSRGVHGLDFLVANVENAAAGFGVTKDILEEMKGLGSSA